MTQFAKLSVGTGQTTIQRSDKTAMDVLTEYNKNKEYQHKTDKDNALKKNRIFGVPQDLLNNYKREFVEQLIEEISEKRKDFAEQGKLVAATPSCVVSRSMFNYMAMALHPNFATGQEVQYSNVMQVSVIRIRPIFATLQRDQEQRDYRDVANTTNLVWMIANNLLDRTTFIKHNTEFNYMRVVTTDCVINFGVDDSLESGQARACFDDGRDKELTIGISDNRDFN